LPALVCPVAEHAERRAARPSGKVSRNSRPEVPWMDAHGSLRRSPAPTSDSEAVGIPSTVRGGR
jgi:hypothetical protein